MTRTVTPPNVSPSVVETPLADPPRHRRLAYFFPPICAMVLIAAVIIIGGNLWQSHIQTRADTERTLQSIGHALAEQTARTLQTVDLSLISVIDSVRYTGVDWHSDDPRTRDFMREKRNLSPAIQSLFTLDSRGWLSLALNNSPTPRIDLSDRPYFAAHRATPNLGLMIGGPIISRVIGRWLIPLSRRLESEDGHFNGVIVAVIEPPVLIDLYRPVNLGEQAEVALLRDDGTLLVHYPEAPDRMGKIFPGSGVSGPLSKQQVFTTADSPVDGVRRLYFRAKVPHSEMHVVVGFSEAVVFADWRRNMVAYAIIAPILLMTLGTMILWLFRDLRRRDSLVRALQLSQERFRDFAQAASDRLWETDELHRFTWHSSAKHPSRFIGRTRWGKPGSQDDPQMWRKHQGDLAARRPFRDFQYSRRQPDGSLRYRSVSGAPFFDKAGRFLGYRGTYTDITSRIAAEQQATMHRDRFLRAIENLGEGFALYDAADNLVVCNTQFRELHKESKDKLEPGTAFEEFLRACLAVGHITEARGREEDWLATRLAEHRNPPNVLEVMRSGRWYQIREQRDPSGGTLFFVLDIHDQKTSELRNEALNERIRKQFECMPVACLALSPDFTMVDWNPAATKIFGFSREEMLGKSPYDTIVPESSRPRVMAIERRLRGGETNIAASGENLTKDGRRILCDWFSTPIWDADRTCTGILCMAMDVTDRRQAEEKLRQAHRMEAVGQLTGGIAHDFNNLLQVIFGNSEILVQRLTDRPDLARWAEMSRIAAQRGASLTQRLLAFSRQQVLAPTAVEPRSLIKDFVELLTLTLPENIEIVPRLGNNLGTLMLDIGQLENALLNLALNARDAMPHGGRLTIEAKRHLLRGGEFADVGPGDYVALAVADTGTGMPPSVAKRAFEPFFTTKEVDKGSGLGLSMVYGFVQQSGGQVHIESRENVGTTVTMWFPRIAWKKPAATKAAKSIDALPTGSESILVVEDDAMVRSYVTDQLRGLGYAVREADTAASALDSLTVAGPVDLLFTDCVMPGRMNGRQLAIEVARRFPKTRILFTSGYSDAYADDESLPDGVQILSKPYFRHDLARRIRDLLDATADALT